MKDELGNKIMKEFVTLRREISSYQADDGYVEKKAKETVNFKITRIN